MKKPILTRSLIIAALVMSGLIAAHAGGNRQEDTNPATPAQSDARSREAGNSMMAAVDPAKAVFDLTGLAPKVLPFSTEAAAQALASRRQLVYFFAASWCPSCRETYRNLKADIGGLPEDLTIVMVDYDKSADLKAKYGVVYQHTFILIGPTGEVRKTWSGSRTVAEILRNLAGG